jgi:hypothetical protein
MHFLAIDWFQDSCNSDVTVLRVLWRIGVVTFRRLFGYFMMTLGPIGLLESEHFVGELGEI